VRDDVGTDDFAQLLSCSIAAARNVSAAATTTFSPSSRYACAAWPRSWSCRPVDAHDEDHGRPARWRRFLFAPDAALGRAAWRMLTSAVFSISRTCVGSFTRSLSTRSCTSPRILCVVETPVSAPISSSSISSQTSSSIFARSNRLDMPLNQPLRVRSSACSVFSSVSFVRLKMRRMSVPSGIGPFYPLAQGR